MTEVRVMHPTTRIRSPQLHRRRSAAQRILDVRNFLAGIGMKSGASPVLHPLDQFRRNHPLLEQEGQDVGLEQAPQDDSIEDGGMDETTVRPEGRRGSQDMQVGMPVQKLPGGLDGNDSGGKSVPFRVFPEDPVIRLIPENVQTAGWFPAAGITEA
jgi:hypothetical protein